MKKEVADRNETATVQTGVVPRFIDNEKGCLSNPEEVADKVEWFGQVYDIFGASNNDSFLLLLNQLLPAVGYSADDGGAADTTNRILPLLRAINPSNELEGMLAVQMIGIHSMAMAMMDRAMQANQTVVGVNYNVNRVTKLTRTFIAQMDALNKHRSKGQQKMTVEHVHVNEGGQAVIGSVDKGGGKNEN